MRLFYNPEVLPGMSAVQFSKEESRHISRVLRLQPGDPIQITNGLGSVFHGKLTDTDSKTCRAEIDREEKKPPLPYQLHLAVAPTKSNDRFEWFLEKAVEIGISEITPVICQYSERRKINAGRYEKILQNAMKQSLQAYLPVLNPAIPFQDFIEKNKSGADLNLIAHCYEGQKQKIQTVLQPGKSVTILLGPEGDFSQTEVGQALSAGFCPVSLGKNRLRTETAAVVACHSVAFVNDV